MCCFGGELLSSEAVLGCLWSVGERLVGPDFLVVPVDGLLFFSMCLGFLPWWLGRLRFSLSVSLLEVRSYYRALSWLRVKRKRSCWISSWQCVWDFPRRRFWIYSRFLWWGMVRKTSRRVGVSFYCKCFSVYTEIDLITGVDLLAHLTKNCVEVELVAFLCRLVIVSCIANCFSLAIVSIFDWNLSGERGFPDEECYVGELNCPPSFGAFWSAIKWFQIISKVLCRILIG